MSTAKPLEFKYNQGIFPINYGSIDASVPIPENALALYDYRQSSPTEAITELVNRQSQQSTDRLSDVNPKQVNGTLKAYLPGEAALIPGKVGGVLIQGSATTLLENSGLSGVIALIVNWSTFGVIDSVQQSNVFTSVNSATFLSSSSQNFIQQTIAGVTIGDEFTLSCGVESIDGSISINNIISMQTPGNFTRQYSYNGVDVADGFLIPGPGTIDLRITATVAATGFFRIGCGTGSNATGSITASLPQIVTGLIPSSFILSPIGSTEARVADNSTIPAANFPVNNFIWTFNVEVLGVTASFSRLIVTEVDGSNLTQIEANGSSTLLSFRKGGVNQAIVLAGVDLSAGGRFKIVYVQSSTLGATVFVNDVSVGSDSSAYFQQDIQISSTLQLGNNNTLTKAINCVYQDFLLEPLT